MTKKPVKKPVKKKKSNAGAKSKYKQEYIEEAFNLCLLGARDIDLASTFGVHMDTIQEWKKIHPEFSAALTRGKSKADAYVASALYNRATGAEYKEEVAIKVKVGQFEEEVRKVEVIKREPPDTNAAIFWLTNRQRKAWKKIVNHADIDQKKENEPQKITFKMDKDIEREEKDAD